MISEKPIIGHGTGSYYKEELNYYNRLENYFKQNKKIKISEKKELENFYSIAGHTHNEFLQIYVENGILGFLLMLFIVIYIIYDFVVDYRAGKIITFLPLLAIVIITNFSFPLHMIHNLVLTGIMLGGNKIDN
ncbi:hypothetical protein HLVA_01400 [Haliovirga abyssi]|uniref:O-antigen ligase-related domain-containing protein n=2 Tax=Haliovirga abyssi TaxID=2996794 RepID=A0AAU9D0T1_9FUSO|nr:hypothetical protein HLVA_01400 [Haliovirga abyssi]